MTTKLYGFFGLHCRQIEFVTGVGRAEAEKWCLHADVRMRNVDTLLGTLHAGAQATNGVTLTIYQHYLPPRCCGSVKSGWETV